MQETKVKIPFNPLIGTHLDPAVRSLNGKTVKVVGFVKTPRGKAYKIKYNGVETQILASLTEPVTSLP